MSALGGLPNYPPPAGRQPPDADRLGSVGDPRTRPGVVHDAPTTDTMVAVIRGRRAGRREAVSVAVVVALMALGWWIARPDWPTERVAVAGPVQTEAVAAPIAYRGATLTPLARFDVDGIVVGVERYWLDGGARYSPVDIGIVWGLAAEPDMFRLLSYSQSGRFLWWRTQSPLPVTQDELDASLANIHALPASRAVRRQLTRLDPGDRVRLEGWLVSLAGADGFVWRSSLVRTDTGNGACELMFVERVTRM